MLGWAALELELELGALVLAPPEAEPDFESLFEASPEADPLMPAEELDEAPGVAVEPVGAGVLDAPPVPPTEAEPDAEPEGLDGVVAPLGEAAVLELEEPGAVVVRFGLSASHAASPKARATAAVRMDSFMCPPWLGYRSTGANYAPGLTP